MTERQRKIQIFLAERDERQREAARLAEAAAFERYPDLRRLKAERTDLQLAMLALSLEAEGPAEAAERKRLALRLEAAQEALEQFCRQHGLPADLNFRLYDCELCEDKGYIDGHACTCLRNFIAALDQEVGRFSIPDDYSLYRDDPTLFPSDCSEQFYGGTISPLEVHDGLKEIVLESARRALNGEPLYLYFFGPTGTGKSFWMGTLGRLLLEKGRRVAYVSTPELLELYDRKRTMDQRFQSGGKADQELLAALEQVEQADCLLLDDLGTENPSDYHYRTLLELLNRRLYQKRSLLISGNWEPQELGRFYDDRVRSRIQGHFELLPVKGNDLRLRRAIRRAGLEDEEDEHADL